MKRLLKEDEIEYILDFLKPNKNIPIESALSIIKNLKLRLLKQLTTIEIYPELIDELKKNIEKNYRESLIHPGESVGIIAAQSIGEKNTQSTLNSVDWKEKIIYSKNNNIDVKPIGKFIDNLLIDNPNNIEKIEENRTEYLKLEEEYFIPSCDENGNTNWYKIEAVTKHLPVGKLVKVITKSGREVLATQSKSFLVWNETEEKFLATAGSDIKIGDILPTTEYLPKLNNIKIQEYFEYKNEKILLDKEIGFLIGVYISMNTFENENLFLENVTNSGTIVPSFSYNCSYEYIKGLLSGFFQNCICDNGSIICISYYEDIIHGILFLLNYYGIFGFITKGEDDIVYKLEIKENVEIFKNEFIDNIQRKKTDIYFDKVISIEYINGTTDYVYDLTIESTRNFQLFNGLNVRDTFHKAGQSEKSVTVGVPRFQELLNATKTPKIINCKIFLKEGYESIQEIRETTGHNFVCLTLKDLYDSIEICIDKKDESWYDIFKILYNNKFANHKHCISIKLNSKILFKYKINIVEIVNVIESQYDDLFCVFSPLNNNQLDIFVDITNIKFSEEKLLFVTEENMNEIYLEECVQPILEKMIIFGISGIKNIYFTNENNEWFIETDGTNFQELLGHPIVNMEKLQSNNVWDIFETLGIEAAREFLIQEFLNIMDGINICHVKLLVEKMTYSGTISSISRYTLRKDESGPMAKSSWNIIHGLVIPKVLLVYSYFVSNTSKLRGYLVRSLILNYLRN